MAFIAMIEQFATTLLTKINRLPPIRLALEGSLSLVCHGRRHLRDYRRFS